MNKKKIAIISTSLLVVSSLAFFNTNNIFNSNVRAENSVKPKAETVVTEVNFGKDSVNQPTELNRVSKPHTLKYLPAISSEGMIEPLNVSSDVVSKNIEPTLENSSPSEKTEVEKEVQKDNGIEEYLSLKSKNTNKEEEPKEEIELKSSETSIHQNLKVFSYTDEELDVLAKIIHAEAGAEPYKGKVAVGAVVLNRVKDKKFPDLIEGVVMAKGQFEPVSNGRYDKSMPNQEDYLAAMEALNGVDPTNGATYFYAPSLTKNTWHETLNYLTTIGNHRFFNQN